LFNRTSAEIVSGVFKGQTFFHLFAFTCGFYVVVLKAFLKPSSQQTVHTQKRNYTKIPFQNATFSFQTNFKICIFP
jgi:hypothetical protein